MLAFSIDYYGIFFGATQSVELFCTYIKTTDVQKTVLVLEENLHTDNFKLMPDGIIRLYDYLNDLETVASALAESHILVTGLSVSGDTLEDYFLSKIGGTKDVKSPKN